MSLLILFILGLSIGSFLSVLADRISKGESPLKGKSHCDKCKKTLKWYDLIPLLSFLLLNGKCRYCHARLSLFYPIVELTTGILFIVVALFFLNGSQFPISDFQFPINSQLLITFIYYLFIVSSLIVIFFADLKYGIIPDKVLFPAIIISFLYLFINHSSFIINHLLSAAGASLFFLTLFLITRGRGMGFGDVKFAFLMGLILGFPNIAAALYIAFLTGAIVGCILIIWRKKSIRGTSIPFGPFLVIGILSAIFFGEFLMRNFLRLMVSL